MAGLDEYEQLLAKIITAKDEARQLLGEVHGATKELKAWLKEAAATLPDMVLAEVQEQVGTLREDIREDMRAEARDAIDKLFAELRSRLAL